VSTIGQRLDLVRKREGLSQGAFAELLGISRSSLQNYLKDERDIPTSILGKLMENLSIDPSWVIQGEISEAAMKQKSKILGQIKEIGLAIEGRANDLNIKLTPEERWRLVSQVYTMAIVQNDDLSYDKVTNNFFVDSMFKSNGYE
jgi:transcriptional regulator with XRE-family HTH domain